MIKRIAVACATAGLAALAFAAPASTAAHAASIRPNNIWDGNIQYFSNEAFQSDCARIDSAGALIIGNGDCTTFAYNQTTHTLYDTSNGDCLFYDASGSRDGVGDSYDLAVCNPGSAADQWGATSPENTWSQWYTDANAPNDSMWATGTGTSNPLFAASRNGSSPDDHWHATDS